MLEGVTTESSGAPVGVGAWWNRSERVGAGWIGSAGARCAGRVTAVDEGNTTEIEWLSTKEAAAFLGVQVAVVLKVINNGSLRAYRPGLRNIRIRRSDLEAYLETRVIEPGSLEAEDDEDTGDE